MNERRRRRCGKSLIEMMVVIMAMTAILTVAGRLLYQLARAERSARESVAVGRAELRLARDFRDDVRAASSAAAFQADEQQGLRLTTPDGMVEYVVAAEAVRRTEGDAGRRDAYRLGPVAVTLGVEADRFAVLSIEPALQASNARHSAAGPLQIVAKIGADQLGGGTMPSASHDGTPSVEALRPEGGTP